ncbi:eCIS core domain-containing protein [Granulicella tundricola]|uniref:eCIS core domain-containing protein n=1 Tax=Granulicella tundricola (strain ATCC BAA-1859 / DSM 23138 / MP5ACTX9) TaxID=1198114 RepID=E8X5E4_GRATM|nr:DUF4157 domain-containing protein [Granulicella tundricola]ADW69491.1 hypothetical protein AciX9_2456 [Granulicella tundricola MP5ACTX9]
MSEGSSSAVATAPKLSSGGAVVARSARSTPSLSAARAPLLQRECSCGGSGSCETCKKSRANEEAKAQLQRSAATPGKGTAPPSVHRVLSSPGQPLDAGARSFMEPRFGRDFSGVRVHHDAEAAESARAVDAHAYTVGQHIAFDQGRYDPGSSSGQHLLAHELAHTVQQGSVSTAPSVLPYGNTPEYNHLENEAEAMAHAVMDRGYVAPAVSHAGPVLSRAKAPPKPVAPTASNKRPKDTSAATASASAEVQTESARDWTNVKTPELKKAGVKAYAFNAANPGIIAVQMSAALELPKEKGSSSVEDLWKSRASAGALEAIIELASGEAKTRSGLKQTRPPTAELRKIWLSKVGWTYGNAPANWAKAGGDKQSFDPPQAGKKTCQVDHILELQFGGNNTSGNMQMLDGEENQYSGRLIFQNLKAQVDVIVDAFKSDGIDVKGVTDVLVHYDKVKMAGTLANCACCGVEEKAKGIRDFDVSEGKSRSGAQGLPYPMKAGAQEATVIVEDDKDKKVALALSNVPENKQASTLISGMSLETWNRPTKVGGTVDASLDTDSRFPKSLKPDAKKKLHLQRGKDGTLKLPPGNPNIAFHFDYLSDGVFKHLEIVDDKYLVGSGTLRPSIPWIPPFDVAFDKDKFAITKPIPTNKLKLPLGGLKFTPGEIGFELAPEFKPYGTIGFTLDAGKRHLLDGSLELSADANGIAAVGDVKVSLPGVDKAEGHIEYRNRQWSGKVEISASDIAKKIKYVQSGQLIVLFSDKGMSAEGTVMMKLPGTSADVKANLLYDGGSKRWVFQGTAHFKPPGLEPTSFEVTYDGDHLSGKGSTGIKFQGVQGTVTVWYKDEKFSGEGTLQIRKGKATGNLHVVMKEKNGHPLFTGDGSITVQLSDNMIATAGIEVAEDQRVKVKGELAFPKPIKLFDGTHGDYKFFEVGISIPIPGASIGTFGLNARIDGSLSAGYKLGPGELRDTKLDGTFYPLEDNPDLDLKFTSTIYVGGSAYISGKISGAIELEAGIARVKGGLAITATASLNGFTASKVTLEYSKGKFTAEADFKLLVALALGLALDAFVEGELGVGWFSVSRRKDWNLASYTYNTGLQFGMALKKPIHYDSVDGVKLPTFNDIEWITPSLEPGNLMDKSFGGASTKGDS